MVTCYHCGFAVPEESNFKVTILKQQRDMCCPGCQAVAQAIVDGGLENFYQHRDQPSNQAVLPDVLENLKVYDHPKIQKQFVYTEGQQANIKEADLILEGIVCAACLWLNQKYLSSLTGVLDLRVNYTTHRAWVRWDQTKIQLSDILQAIYNIGYMAHPYDPKQAEQLLENQRKQHLRWLAVAGILGMQVMMLSVAIYAGDYWGMESSYRQFFAWVMGALSSVVLWYSGQSFYKSAWRDLTHQQLGMDVPVVLGLSIAYVTSVVTTILGQGELYYDSVVMFIFLLLVARFFELKARQKARQSVEQLNTAIPALATRVTSEGLEQIVAVDIDVGDKILVKIGEAIPADGVITQGCSELDESLLTGESLPVIRTVGDKVIAGSINISQALEISVTQIGSETVLAYVQRLLQKAQTDKPKVSMIADKIASWFVLAIVILASSVGWYWWQQGNEQWLAISIAVLVATCPCALSLATPVAITVATTALTQRGMLTTQGHALETLAKATDFVLDKTGTLTKGQLELTAVETVADISEQQCLLWAVSLEQQANHPIATALRQVAINSPVLIFDNLDYQVGFGVKGQYQGEWFYLGAAHWIASLFAQPLPTKPFEQYADKTLIFLAKTEQLLAVFVLSDSVKIGAKSLIQYLQQQGKQVHLLSGDDKTNVMTLGQQLGISERHYALSPQQKLAYVKRLQQQGRVVAMLGDGINDAPVLAVAQVSIAMAEGTELAQHSSDFILFAENLEKLPESITLINQSIQIIRQNLGWAIAYNVLILPMASMGYLSPWMAAVGMSFSSLLVTLNALRLGNK